MVSRRKFVQLSSAAAVAAAWGSGISAEAASRDLGSYRGTLCLFSKPVPQLTWKELAQHAKAAGFEGIDLTVRTGGHVMPDRAAQDLPKAVEAIRAEGLKVPMITTELINGDDPTAVPIISTAAKLSIPFMKPGYYHYRFVDVRREAEEARNQFRGLVGVAAKYGVQVGNHNHPGNVGSQFWDIAPAIDSLDARDAGYYYDLNNATMEGDMVGWKVGANLAMPRMKMIAAKDFLWEKTKTRGWQGKCCPLGQGMCKYGEFMKMVAASGFQGPMSVHIEYQIPGVSDDQGRSLTREGDDQVMAAAQRDLETLKSMVRTAYATA